jgi:hypothetical protein
MNNRICDSKLLVMAAGVFTLVSMAGSPTALAASPSAASLNGKYVFQIATTKEAYWSNSKKCTGKNGTNTYYASNWMAYTELVNGVATFNGKGEVSFEFTDSYQVDQDASDATIVITCTSDGYLNSGGNIVYEAPESATGTGTYKVESNGSGSITLTIPGETGTVTINLQLAGFESTGVASTALLTTVDGDTNKHLGTGVAAHE